MEFDYFKDTQTSKIGIILSGSIPKSQKENHELFIASQNFWDGLINFSKWFLNLSKISDHVICQLKSVCAEDSTAEVIVMDLKIHEME